MFLLLHLLIFYNLIIWKPCVSYYTRSTAQRISAKLNMLSKELVLDAKWKIDSIQHYRPNLYKTTQYQYGNIVYQMRFRFSKMIKLYARVYKAIQSSPVLDGDAYVTDDKNYIAQVAEMDTLAHEIQNFATMLKMHHAFLYADKSKPGYDLFFRRMNMAPSWLGLVDSLDDNDNIDPPEPPEEDNLTHTSKRANGVWHYVAPMK